MTVVVGFELRRWDASEFVEETVVVEPVDPFEGGKLEVVETAPWPFVTDSRPGDRAPCVLRVLVLPRNIFLMSS